MSRGSQSPAEILPYMSKVALVSILANIILAVAIFVLGVALTNQRTTAIGVTDSGTVIPLVPMTEEYATESRVSSFSEECLRRAFEHDFEHYRRSTTQASNCFTTGGVDSYMKQIEPLTDFIQKHRMVMSISAEPPVILRKGVKNGIYEWEVETISTIYMTGMTEMVQPKKWKTSMVIHRVPLVENIRGMSISNIDLKPVVN